MPIGHITEIRRVPLVQFDVHEHEEQFRPPVYIKEHKALSRIVLLDGVATPFYLGKRTSHSRVTFEFHGVWCYVDFHAGKPINLNDLLWDLKDEYEFVANDELRAFTAGKQPQINTIYTNK